VSKPTDLAAIGALPDSDIAVADAALLLSAARYPDTDLTRYHAHLQALVAAARNGADACQTASERLAHLRRVIHDRFFYDGDTADYDHLDNASLIRVIDRKCGLPVALMILYMHVGRALDWPVVALNFPGHVFGRIGEGTDTVLFDPFTQGQVVQAHDLRAAVKRALGPQAELAAAYTAPMTNREILVRLQNNLKIRLLERGEEAQALEVIEATRQIAPDDARLLFDAGVLQARVGQRQAAITTLTQYLGFITSPPERAEVLSLLRALQATLN
jgi:regulator of sirC expression with transglutaminase-like and TPR domain